MDYSCTMFPVTYVDAELDQPYPPHDFYNHEDEAIYNLCTHPLPHPFSPPLTTNGQINRSSSLARPSRCN